MDDNSSQLRKYITYIPLLKLFEFTDYVQRIYVELATNTGDIKVFLLKNH